MEQSFEQGLLWHNWTGLILKVFSISCESLKSQDAAIDKFGKLAESFTGLLFCLFVCEAGAHKKSSLGILVLRVENTEIKTEEAKYFWTFFCSLTSISSDFKKFRMLFNFFSHTTFRCSWTENSVSRHGKRYNANFHSSPVKSKPNHTETKPAQVLRKNCSDQKKLFQSCVTLISVFMWQTRCLNFQTPFPSDPPVPVSTLY